MPGPNLRIEIEKLRDRLRESTEQRAMLERRVASAAERRMVVRLGCPRTVALLLGVPQDVTFTWSAPFPDDAYAYDVAVAPTLLGKVSVARKAKTAAALTLTLTAPLALAGAVSAVAWA